MMMHAGSFVAASWSADDMWILIVSVLAALACGIPGTFMVLRRMSMMGDAISHAVLPGLAGAFLFTVAMQKYVVGHEIALPEWLNTIVMLDARSGPVMFTGAVIVGLLTAWFTQLVHQHGDVEQSAAMGVVFTTLFALGLIMMVQAADDVDLDAGCVLYGAIELTPLDRVAPFGIEMPRAALVLGAMTLINALFVIVFYKELKITSFDPTLATTLGIRATIMHYLLMTIIALTAVAAFESVGSILVVAMLIVPGATAHLLTDRLWTMLLVSAAASAIGASIGAVATAPDWIIQWDVNTAGMIASAGGGLFLLAALFAPRHGVLVKLIRRTALSISIVSEDALGLLYRLEEHQRLEPASSFRKRLSDALGASGILVALAMMSLRRRELAGTEHGAVRLTEKGRVAARSLVRSHRLWETWLVQHLDLAPDHVHDAAMRLEHVTGGGMQEALAAHTHQPSTDPHGHTIPPADK